MLNLKERKCQAMGFTLIEVLMAFTIMAMIVGILTGVLRLGIRAWEKGQERVDSYQHMRIFMEQLIEDIRSAYLADSEKVTSFIGEGNKITFHSATSGVQPESKHYGVRRVSYYVDEESNLVMEESFPFDDLVEGKEALPLYSGVVSIEFRYYQVKEGSKEWVNSWDSKQARRLPSAVEVALTVTDAKGREMKLPPMVTPISVNRVMNTTAAAVGANPQAGSK